MHLNVIFKDFISRHSATIQLAYVGVWISMVLNLQIPAQEENQIVVSNIFVMNVHSVFISRREKHTEKKHHVFEFQ